MSKWDKVNAARALKQPGSMNGVESARARVLEGRKLAGEITDYRFQHLKLKTGEGRWYIPDFLVIELDMTYTVEEVKGTAGWKLDSESKSKFLGAVMAHPWFRFRSVIKKTKKAGGGFEERDYAPCDPFP